MPPLIAGLPSPVSSAPVSPHRPLSPVTAPHRPLLTGLSAHRPLLAGLSSPVSPRRSLILQSLTGARFQRDSPPFLGGQGEALTRFEPGVRLRGGGGVRPDAVHHVGKVRQARRPTVRASRRRAGPRADPGAGEVRPRQGGGVRRLARARRRPSRSTARSGGRAARSPGATSRPWRTARRCTTATRAPRSWRTVLFNRCRTRGRSWAARPG